MENSGSGDIPEPVKWAVLTAIGVLLREGFSRLKRSPRPNGHLDRSAVLKIIAEHSATQGPVKNAAYFERRIHDIQQEQWDAIGEIRAAIEGIERRLDLRDSRTAGAND